MKKKKTERKLRRRSDRHGESDGREGAREKIREILLIKKRSTTRGDGINQSSALMRHLLIMLK